MNSSLDATLVFLLLLFFSLWGGGALGSGLWARRPVPIAWGLLIGATPFYFGLERLLGLGQWWGLFLQVSCLLGAAVFTATLAPGLRAFFLRPGMSRMMIGTFIMAGGAIVGAWFFRLERELASLAIGGGAFLFGAMWFGAGMKELRGR